MLVKLAGPAGHPLGRTLPYLKVVGLCVIFLVPGAKTLRPDQYTPRESADEACLAAAKKMLGPETQVFKCGHLTGTDALETAAGVRLRQFRLTREGTPVSKFVVLRRENSQWVTELRADQAPLRNPVGYIATDYIDDSHDYGRYRVSFYDEGSNQLLGLFVDVFYLSPRGENEGIPVEIGWNPKVGRFQEYTENRDPVGFQPENANPRHIRTRR